MSWSRFDDRYDDHPKVMAATHANALAAAIYPQAITAASRRESDGLVDPFWLLARAPDKRKRTEALAVLVRLRLFDVIAAGETWTGEDDKGHRVTLGPFEEDRHIVHDYLDFNPSSAQLQEKRRLDSERKANGRRKDSDGSPAGHAPDSAGTPSGPRGRARGSAPAGPHPIPSPSHPNPQEPPPAPPNKFGGEPGIAGDLSRVKPNPRAAGTNPRAIGRQHVQAVSANAAAVLDSPSDTERRAWEQLHALLARSVEGGAGAVHVMDAYLAGIDGGVFVIDAPTTAWAWLVARADRALPACCDRLGVRARLASDAEHEGLQRVAA